MIVMSRTEEPNLCPCSLRLTSFYGLFEHLEEVVLGIAVLDGHDLGLASITRQALEKLLECF